MPTKPVPWSWILVLTGIALVILVMLLFPPVPTDHGPVEELAPQTPPPTRDDTFGTMLRVGANAILVEHQKSGTSEVVVSLAVLEKAGYVVIHEDDNGVPGAIIGASALLPTGGENIRVAVDKTLVDGSVYYAMLHVDDGDDTYDPAKDKPVTDAQGNIILMSFTASVDAEPGSSVISL